MSYILDALKKAEQDERNRERLQLDNLGLPPEKRHNTWWPFWLAATLLGGIAIALQVGIWGENYQILDTKAAETSLVLDIPKTKAHQYPEVINPLPLTLSDLPKSLANQVPKMEFSSHIYSQDSSLRSVTIDNQIYRENDQIAKELYLEEINEIGIVIRYQGNLAEISFLEDWLNISNP
ncbi:MAG: hypothetical protein CBB61_006180 [Gammaproteobacteria bacterium TMED1]|nr:MAG: hypothetical protein CBB61_006180 [Gammaproteobacteria bacterium TMED1]